ncbi:NB-ARC domain-containing protein [Streptomyces nondiastaticus]|uniref:NB-ARC domain-containing protein n=1 Tax=Streptomyces nondiastaticus TaxID=3154512 RepID=UPI003412B50E
MIDAALLQLDEPFALGGTPVRWGRPEGLQALDYDGIGFPLLARYGDVPHVEQLRGQLPPLSTGPAGCYVLDQRVAPRASSSSGRRPWSGASGTAVFCRGLLVGVVVRDDREFDHRRLHALPVEGFIGLPDFAELVRRDTGTTPQLEPVNGSESSPDTGTREPTSVPRQPSGNAASGDGPRVDLREAPEVPVIFGRGEEIETLRQWLREDDCRLVAVLGRGGMGKTTLAAHLAATLRDGFDVVFWRSLFNAQQLAEVLQAFVRHASNGEVTDLPDSLEERLLLVRQLLRDRRCLLVLDNAESLFEGGAPTAASYLPGLADYGALFDAVAAGGHRSCLLLTSREMPTEIIRLRSDSGPVRTMNLGGLSDKAGRHLMADRGLTSPVESWSALIERYSGNPLELKVVCDTVLRVFRGDVTAFLREDTGVVGGTHQLLVGQFGRMSSPEQAVMYWFAVRREPVTLGELERDVVPPATRRELIAALDSLTRRSMAGGYLPGSFATHPVILEFVSERLLDAMFREIVTGSPELFSRHALTLATARQYIREAQARTLVAPLVRRLLGTFGLPEVTRMLRDLLAAARRGGAGPSVGYTAANVLQIVLHLGLPPSDFDFSALTVREADLRGATLRDVDFTAARFERTLFTDTFGVIRGVAVSSDGAMVAAGTGSGDIRVWQLADARPTATWHEHSGTAWAVAFGNHDRILASAGADRTVRVWDLRTHRCVQVCHGPGDAVVDVACHPTEPLVAGAAHDNTGRVWNALTGRLLHTLQGHGNWVSGVAYAPDGETLVTCSLDGTVRVWDGGSGGCLRVLADERDEQPDSLWSVAVSPDGRSAAAGGFDGIIRVWELSTGALTHTLRAHADRVTGLAFDPADGLLASASADRTVRVWDLVEGRRLETLAGHELGVSGTAFVPGIKQLVSGGDDQTVRVWDSDRGECLMVIRGHEQPVRAVVCAPDGGTIASAGDDTDIRLWTARAPHRARTLRGHQHWVQALAFSPDGRLLASTGDDRTVRLWDVAGGQCLHVLHGHTGWVADVAFSADGTRVASGGAHSKIRLWDAVTGQLITIIDAYDSSVGALAFSSDGLLLVSGGHDHRAQVKLWDAQTGEHLATLARHIGAVTSLAIAADSRRLVTSGVDGYVNVWDLGTSEQLHTLTGHGNRVSCVAVEPSGRLAASGGEDRTVHVWDLAEGRCVQVLRGHPGAVTSVDFSNDGKTLVSASTDGTVRLWEHVEGKAVGMLVPDRPYERMRLAGSYGLTDAQREALRRLGAVDNRG